MALGSRSAGAWGYDPEREAQWAAEIYPALLREMARRPEWAREIIQAREKRLGQEAAEALRRDALTAYARLRVAGGG